MEILIIVAAAVVWFALRSRGTPPPQTARDYAAEGVKIGIGWPLAIIVVLAFLFLIGALGGTMATGGCDVNASTGEPGDCYDTAINRFEQATGLQHYNSFNDWRNGTNGSQGRNEQPLW